MAPIAGTLERAKAWEEGTDWLLGAVHDLAKTIARSLRLLRRYSHDLRLIR